MNAAIVKKYHALVRGSALVVTLVLISVISMSLLLMARTTIDQQKLNRRIYDRSRALYAAEAGIALVQHWGNYAEDFTIDPTLFFRDEDGGTAAEQYPNLNALLSSNYTIDKTMLHTLSVGSFNSYYGYATADIDEIELIPADPATDPVACFFKIRSVGESATGVEREVLAYVNVSPIISIQAPAALISYNVAAAFGNARIHWGESWSKNDFNMLNRSQMTYLRPSDSDYDSWAKYRTEGQITFPDNWKWGVNKDLDDPTREQPGLAPASGDYADAFYQHLPAGTLTWPVFDYQTFKDLALSHGRYYSTDAAGNIYRDGIEDAAHLVVFLDEFGVADRSTAPYDLIFIDTIDNQPAAADGSNLADVIVSGNSLGLKGVAYIAANLDGSGVGSPPSMVGVDPAGNSETLNQIFLDGALFVEGTLALSGNAGIYGSAITRRGFTGGGTPNIYYNSELASGLRIGDGNIGSYIRVVLQKN